MLRLLHVSLAADKLHQRQQKGEAFAPSLAGYFNLRAGFLRALSGDHSEIWAQSMIYFDENDRASEERTCYNLSHVPDRWGPVSSTPGSVEFLSTHYCPYWHGV